MNSNYSRLRRVRLLKDSVNPVDEENLTRLLETSGRFYSVRDMIYSVESSSTNIFTFSMHDYQYRELREEFSAMDEVANETIAKIEYLISLLQNAIRMEDYSETLKEVYSCGDEIVSSIVTNLERRKVSIEVGKVLVFKNYDLPKDKEKSLKLGFYNSASKELVKSFKRIIVEIEEDLIKQKAEWLQNYLS